MASSLESADARARGRTISGHWRSLLKKDWQSVGDAVAAIAAQFMNVTAGTSRLNQQPAQQDTPSAGEGGRAHVSQGRIGFCAYAFHDWKPITPCENGFESCK